MEKKAFDEYFEERYLKQMDFYHKASARNRIRYKQFQWILIILSALAPVLAALNSKGTDSGNAAVVLRVSLVVVSSIVAILTTGLKTFNYLELWVSYRGTYERLKPEIHYYNFDIGPYSETGISKESLFVSRIEAILDTEHKQWPAIRSKDDQPKTKEGEGPVLQKAEAVPAAGINATKTADDHQ